jgi:hypothetical protein
MCYFFDTCIIVGYTFRWDPHHDDSTGAVLQNKTSYISKTVLKESYTKHVEYVKKYSSFLNRLINKLDRTSFQFSKSELLDSFHDDDKDFDKYKKEINELWKDHNFQDKSNSTIVKILSGIKKLIVSSALKRRHSLKIKCIEMDERTEKYPYECELLKESGVHYPDNEIVIDAHHLSLNIDSNLDFISTDWDLLQKAKGITNIHDFVHLKSLFN